MLGKNVFQTLVACGVLVASASASKQGYVCPDVWRQIGKYLKHHFINAKGECNEAARQSIRIPFHDCFPSGGCDGSLILSDECTTRRENAQMAPMCGRLLDIKNKYGVGAADLINFAASVANKACPYGPYVPFLIGRNDSSKAAPVNQLTPPNASAPDAIAQFDARGFASDELVALLGAHSVAFNLQRIPFDFTPGKMDAHTYYGGVMNKDAPFILPADRNLAVFNESRGDWIEYAHSQKAWITDYVNALTKMLLLENNMAGLIDCSEIVYDLYDRDDVKVDDDYY